jgi:hypothetical membrane protein
MTGVEVDAFSSSQKILDLKVAGILYTIAGLVTILSVTISEALYPNYSVHSNTISDLSAIGAPTQLIEGSDGLLRAVCFLLGGYLLFRKTGKRGPMLAFVMVGVGTSLATFSPENFNVAIHSIGAVITFFSAVVIMFYSYRIIQSPFRYFSVCFAVITLAATLILFLGYSSPFVQQTLGPGGWERVIAHPILIWSIGFGSYLLSMRSPQEGSR